jgi:CrcB protein
MTPLTLLAVFLGGGSGASCRYAVGHFIGSRYGGEFPLGTFLINVSGCFALGLLAIPIALLATGFLGGYTTFSTYALEGVLLFEDGSRRLALMSLLGSVAAGMLAAAAGAGLAPLL